MMTAVSIVVVAFFVAVLIIYVAVRWAATGEGWLGGYDE